MSLLAGTIVSYAGQDLNHLPSNWIPCDGRSVEATQYPKLYSSIGNSYGSQQEGYFNLPDLRGMFLRGVDNGANIDPDSSLRVAAKPNGNTGDMVGSMQLDGFASHTHTLGQPYGFHGSGDYPVILNNSGTDGITGATGGKETRPINIYVNYLIYAGPIPSHKG